MRIIVRTDDRVVARCPHCHAVVLRRSGDGMQCIGQSIVMKKGRIGGECRSCLGRWLVAIPEFVK